MSEAQGICPVCHMPYYSHEVIEDLDKTGVRNVSSNTLYGECGRMRRGPDDGRGWKYESFGHTTEQVQRYRRTIGKVFDGHS